MAGTSCGHPRLGFNEKKDVNARPKAGHDEAANRALISRSHPFVPANFSSLNCLTI
jgi:hypothetical protein